MRIIKPYIIALFSAEVRKAIERCIQVFEERHIFPEHIIQEMKATLEKASAGGAKRATNVASPLVSSPSSSLSTSAAAGATTTTPSPDDGRGGGSSSTGGSGVAIAIADIDHNVLIREAEQYAHDAELTEKARSILARSDFNFKERLRSRMKDRAEGTKILAEMDDSREKLQQFLASVEHHEARCQRLIELFTAAKASFALQLKDVGVVDDVSGGREDSISF